jgi:hypothetical protein
MAIAVIAIHLLLAIALWQTLRTREVAVSPQQPALLWLRPAPAPVAAATKPPRATPPTQVRRTPRPVAPPPQPIATPKPGESEWVQPPVPVAAAPSASAASAPPAERLLDTEATRLAIRQSARGPLLHERATQAMGEDIARTDTGMAGGVASAGKPDCAKMQAPGGILGLPIVAAMVASGKCSTK